MILAGDKLGQLPRKLLQLWLRKIHEGTRHLTPLNIGAVIPFACFPHTKLFTVYAYLPLIQQQLIRSNL